MNFDHIQVNTQSSIRIEGSKVVYFDPFQISAEPHDADLICITHAHYDHFDPKSIENVSGQDTELAAPASMAKEAAELINQIKPAAAIPTHYGSIVGKPKDADTFRKLVDKGIQVVIKL